MKLRLGIRWSSVGFATAVLVGAMLSSAATEDFGALGVGDINGHCRNSSLPSPGQRGALAPPPDTARLIDWGGCP